MSSTANATLVYVTEDNLEDYSYVVGDGTIGIVDTTSAPGTLTNLSLELIWPTSSDDAGIQITDLGDPTVSSIIGWDYWVKAPEYYNPHLTMFLDTDGDLFSDTEARVSTYNSGYGDEWLNIDSSGDIRFRIESEGGSGYSPLWTWSEFQEEFGDAVVEEIVISHYGYYISGNTAYLDDFTFGDTDYAIGIPEPTTIALLGLGSVLLLRRRR